MKTGRKTKAQLVKELEALRKINATIGTLLAPHAILQRIIDEIVPLFAAQAASVILFDYATQEAEITTAYGTQTRQEKPLRYPLRGTLSEWIAEHKRPLRLSRPIKNDWSTSAKLAEQLGGSLEKISVLLAPLWQEGVVIGCLEVVWDPQRDIANGDEQLLETIATQVAIAIANAKLHQEKELALQAVQENEERYRLLSQLISDCAFSYRITPNGSFFLDWLTESFSKISGYDIQEFFAKPDPWRSIIHPEDLVPLSLVFQKLAPDIPTVHEFRIIRKDGEVRWLRGYFSLHCDTQGIPLRMYGAAQDITERKRAEMALRESEERYRIVSQCMSDYAFSFRIEDDKASFMEWLTDSFTRVTGYPVSDFLGKSNPWARYIHPQDLERVNATVRQMQPGVPTTYEFRIIRRDGETRWIRSYAYAIRGEKGSVTRLYGAAQDITERKHAEDMLRYQRAFEQLIANISKDFLNLAPEEIDQGVLRALHMVGEFSTCRSELCISLS